MCMCMHNNLSIVYVAFHEAIYNYKKQAWIMVPIYTLYGML